MEVLGFNITNCWLPTSKYFPKSKTRERAMTASKMFVRVQATFIMDNAALFESLCLLIG